MPANTTTTTTTATPRSPHASADAQKARAVRLQLHGLVARWEEVRDAPWLPTVIDIEETERQRRSLERRIRNARIGRFKPMADFDWGWPEKVDRDLIEECFTLDFVATAANLVIVGTSGLGKTMIAQNLAHQAVLRGHTVRFITASEMLNDLAAQESASALARRLRRYCQPALLCVDEVGYLSYDCHHADLLFQVVSRRNEQKSTIVTTNKSFKEWNQVFPNAGSVVALIDRLVHRAEVVRIEGESYRAKEATEREAARARERTGRRGKGKAACAPRAATKED
jgi:DNA replication protein DnaC